MKPVDMNNTACTLRRRAPERVQPWDLKWQLFRVGALVLWRTWREFGNGFGQGVGSDKESLSKERGGRG